MESAYDIVKAIIDEKKVQRKRPLLATAKEISDRCSYQTLKAELDMHVELGLLITGRTANHQYFRLPGEDFK